MPGSVTDQIGAVQVLYLYILFCKLLSERATASGYWVHGIIDCYLAILVAQEMGYIVAAFLHDFLPQKHR
jgi:hypothetical protein